MEQRPETPLTGRDIFRLIALVMTAQVCVLFFRAWMQRTLVSGGMDVWPASNLSYLAVFPLLPVLLYPVLKEHAGSLRHSLRPRALTWRIVIIGFTLGLALRLAFWGSLLFRIGFGWIPEIGGHASFIADFRCPSIQLMALHLLVMAGLVPLTEELINRAWFAQWLSRYGSLVAIIVSAALFTLVHTPDAMIIAFIFGLYAARFYLSSQTLWGTLAAHITFNGLILIDWYCANITWVVGTVDSSARTMGFFGFLVMLAMLAFSALLISKSVTERAR